MKKIWEEIKSILKNILPRDIYLVLLVMFIVLWFSFVAPRFFRIPDDLSYSADVVSVDNFFDENSMDYEGEKYSKTTFSYNAVGKQEDKLIVRNVFDVRSLDGKQIFKTEPLYGIDPKTGKHVAGFGDRNREGYLFAPHGVKNKQPFTYWHVSSNVPAKMEFVGEDLLYGLRVFKYRRVNNEPIDQTEFMSFISGVPEKRGIKLQSELYLWIEPVSGHVVNIRDFSTDYFFFDIKTGERLNPYNKFSNTFSENSIAQQVEVAKEKKINILLVYNVVPFFVVFFLLVLVLFRLGYLGGVKMYLYRNRVSAFVLVITFSLSITAFIFVQKSVNKKINQDLLSESFLVSDSIKDRLNTYTNVLRGGKALFSASKSVEREEWYSYIASLDISKNFPGLQGVGYIKIVPESEMEEFLNSIKKEGFNNFRINPTGEREMYYPVYFIEPFDERNQRAFGFDMYSETDRKMAMEHSRDSGNAIATRKLNLVQDISDDKYGFNIYLAVYKNNSPIESVEERRENILGFIYIPMRPDFIVDTILDGAEINIDFDIYDGFVVDDADIIYTTIEDKENNLRGDLFQKTDLLYIDGTPWTIRYQNKPSFRGTSTQRSLPIVVLVGGLFSSFLLLLISQFTSKSKERAVLYAEELNESLRKSETELSKKNKEMERKIAEMDKLNKLMVNRELKMVEMKNEMKNVEVAKKD